ncbi:hypothetical protein FOXB_11753 [Fusarium oxysporum f. sp. conglutinans Fo5176]|uniref:Uncharacterized protein n=1 Tax=Fusarium oxysporum (strain Fo5176) TaxID=660025 RepID=F9FZC1_FUSOF|nr:hypothetical protein FOXB_11753 [Fusarium oxysporum f. sp. conglutinans Fo5176]
MNLNSVPLDGNCDPISMFRKKLQTSTPA